MKSKPTRSKLSNTKSRQTLLSQGRYFKCHKKGHLAKACQEKHASQKTLANLSRLPVEILELICEHLTSPDVASLPAPQWLLSLRLVCRSINLKLHDLFGRRAFGTLGIKATYRNLQRVNEIARSPFAVKVGSILLSNYEEHLWAVDEYDQLVQAVQSGRHSRRARRVERILQLTPQEQAQSLKETHQEQDEKAFIERSGTLGITFALALLKMPNIRTFEIQCTQIDMKSVRREKTGKGESTTALFLAVVAGLAHTNLKPHAIKFRRFPDFGNHEGVSLQALAMPPGVLNSLSELRHLELRLETRDNVWKDPMAWDRRLSTFLKSCRKLAFLELSFRNQWTDTGQVFHQVARRVQLPDLKTLRLEGIRCEADDLGCFLYSHKELETLSLRNLDLTGEHVALAVILKTVELCFNDLQKFECFQVAQNSFRTYFESLGRITVVEAGNDFLEVQRPNKYIGDAEAWEGVQEKIGLLLKDMHISGLPYQSDFHPLFGLDGYAWLRQP